MVIKENLIRARSHIIFLIGLIAAFGIVIGLERWQPQVQMRAETNIEKTRKIALAPAAMLTEQEMGWGKIAKELGVSPSVIGQSVSSLRSEVKGEKLDKKGLLKDEKKEAREARKAEREQRKQDRKEAKAERKSHSRSEAGKAH